MTEEAAGITIARMASVSVSLSSGSYRVAIDPGLLARLGQELRSITKSAKVCVVTDSHVAESHLPRVENALRGEGLEVISATIPAGEQHKTVQTILPLYDRFLSARIERSTPIIALGGGVIGDMTGFLAATILRGVPFVQAPTTLLAMVDASVGGKTGVDHPMGKNLIGAFHQPIGVFADPEVLTTLPQREIQNGLAECIKHDLIRDGAAFASLDKKIAGALALDMNVLTEVVAHNVAIKARVVEADPFEKGERAHLNLGHTFGHAIESVSGFSYSHGQSVALGICAAAWVSMKFGYIPENDRKQILTTIAAAGLPTGGLKLDVKTVMEAMASDKKVRDGKIRLVLLEKIGKAIVRDDVSRELIQEGIENLR
jgi:3-dehydroquinate synthase